MVNPHKTVLKGTFGRYEEGRAGGAIKPGHLIKLNSDSEYVVQTAAGEAVERAFAIEDSLQGNTIDDDYADGDLLRIYVAAPGDVIYAMLSDGETVVEGDQVMSNGDGTVAKLSNAGTAYANAPIGVALEDVDLNAGTATGDGRLRIRIV